jgi:hypothetical protein
MKPHSIGRTAGIGLRVAARIAGKRVAGATTGQNATPDSGRNAANANIAAASRSAGQTAGRTSRGLARGLGGFLRPFARVGGILWLEVTGVFFFVPVFVFAPTLWRIRGSYAHGPDHTKFLVTAAVIAVFLYLGVSSFWRARKR